MCDVSHIRRKRSMIREMSTSTKYGFDVCFFFTCCRWMYRHLVGFLLQMLVCLDLLVSDDRTHAFTS